MQSHSRHTQKEQQYNTGTQKSPNKAQHDINSLFSFVLSPSSCVSSFSWILLIQSQAGSPPRSCVGLDLVSPPPLPPLMAGFALKARVNVSES